jgi:hypothetical protein
MDNLVKKMKTFSWAYADKDLASLEIVEKRIHESGKDLKLITYSDLVKGIEFHIPNINNGSAYQIKTYDWSGLDRRIIGDFLGYASFRSYEKYGFMASALVVNRDEYRPSWHFFLWMKELEVLPDLEEPTVLAFWIDHVNKAHNWYKSNRRR